MTTQESPLTVQGSGAENKKQSDVTSNDIQAQQQRLLNHLRVHGNITTIEARRDLDIMHPAARVMELKRQGYRIETIWVNDVTEAGKIHRVARYVLVSGRS